MFSDAPAAQIEITKTSPYSISRIAGKEFRSPIVHADQNPISAHQFNVELQRCSVFCGLDTSCYTSQSVVLVVRVMPLIRAILTRKYGSGSLEI